MESSYSSDPALSNQSPSRLRAVIEFVEGDLTRPPIVFPEGGTEEADARLREAILKRWAR